MWWGLIRVFFRISLLLLNVFFVFEVVEDRCLDNVDRLVISCIFWLLLLVEVLIINGVLMCLVFWVRVVMDWFFLLYFGMVGILVFCIVILDWCFDFINLMVWVDGLIKIIWLFRYSLVKVLFFDRKLYLGWIVLVLLFLVVVMIDFVFR